MTTDEDECEGCATQQEILGTVELIVRSLEAAGIRGSDVTMLAFHSLAARFVVLLGLDEQTHVDLARAAYSDAMRDHHGGADDN